jgi:iron-sulfur cluster assembly protein
MSDTNKPQESVADAAQEVQAGETSATQAPVGLSLTAAAASRIKKVFAESNMPAGSCLRVAVKGGGCSGFSYFLDVTDKPAEDDEVFESNGVRVICDPKSYLYLGGTEVDYKDDLLKGGFVFNNPNAKRSCGCGSSFSA